MGFDAFLSFSFGCLSFVVCAVVLVIWALDLFHDDNSFVIDKCILNNEMYGIEIN